ncbi:unnamed protein product, partial [Gulo gulo]
IKATIQENIPQYYTASLSNKLLMKKIYSRKFTKNTKYKCCVTSKKHMLVSR